jgi:glucosamine--fructose-6-phosphate aminotransferase (isomerizing)
VQRADGLALIEADLRRQAEVLRASIPDLRESAAALVAGLAPPTAVYLIGSGDSYDGGQIAGMVGQSLIDVPVHAVPAMTFTTSVVDDAPAGSWVVVLSQSGRVSRAVEAIRAASSRLLPTLAITANAGSPLALEPADRTWVIDFQKLGPIPGMTSHLVGAVALLELLGAIAAPNPRSSLQDDLDALPDLAAATLDAAWEPARKHAPAFSRDLPVLLLGYGAGLGVARFVARKLMDISQIVAIAQETEEYAHDQYALVDARFRVVQFAPTDRGRTRNREVMHYLRRLGVHLAVVTDDNAIDDRAAAVVYVVPPAPRRLHPLLQTISGQALSLEAGRTAGGSLYGAADETRAEDNGAQIYDSEIVA